MAADIASAHGMATTQFDELCEFGKVTLAQRRPWRSISFRRAAARLDFIRPEVHELLGRAYIMAQDFSAAADCFERSLSFGAEPLKLRPLLAYSLTRADKPRNAVKHYLRQLGDSPNDPALRSGLG